MSGVTSRTVTVAGGNLFELAVEHYGDPLQWDRIARANPTVIRQHDGIWDPFLEGVVTLVIPPENPEADSGGVFGEP